MYFKQITTPGLGCFSYAIGCPAAGEMVVVDPKRDVQDYLDISREEGMKIVHVIDTHVHADHVSGAQELRSQTGCDIMVYETSPVDYAFTPLKEGDKLVVGNAKLEVLHTPGHTPDSLSLLVTDTTRGDEPWMLLTGDVLFVGDIGRPDLVGGAKLDEQVQNLWHSLYEKYTPNSRTAWRYSRPTARAPCAGGACPPSPVPPSALNAGTTPCSASKTSRRSTRP